MGLNVYWKKLKEKKQDKSKETALLAAEDKPDFLAFKLFLQELRTTETMFESTNDLIDYINFTIRVLIKNIQSEYMSGYVKTKRMPNVQYLVPFMSASVFEDKETIEDFPLEGKNVVSFPHEHKKMFPAFKDMGCRRWI